MPFQTALRSLSRICEHEHIQLQQQAQMTRLKWRCLPKSLAICANGGIELTFLVIHEFRDNADTPTLRTRFGHAMAAWQEEISDTNLTLTFLENAVRRTATFGCRARGDQAQLLENLQFQQHQQEAPTFKPSYQAVTTWQPATQQKQQLQQPMRHGIQMGPSRDRPQRILKPLRKQHPAPGIVHQVASSDANREDAKR